MTPPPTSIDGTDISGATIDGQDVQEITVDGQTVFTATTPGVIDDFEGGSLSAYNFGSTSFYSVQSGGQIEGSFYLDGDSDNDEKTIGSDSLPAIPSQGDTWRYAWYLDGSVIGDDGNPLQNAGCVWASSTSGFGNFQSDGYSLGFSQEGGSNGLQGKIQLVSYNNSTNPVDEYETNLFDISSSGGWYEMEVQWKTSNQIIADILDPFNNGIGDRPATLSVSDSTHTTGSTFGWSVNRDRTVSSVDFRFDNARIVA